MLTFESNVRKDSEDNFNFKKAIPNFDTINTEYTEPESSIMTIHFNKYEDLYGEPAFNVNNHTYRKTLAYNHMKDPEQVSQITDFLRIQMEKFSGNKITKKNPDYILKFLENVFENLDLKVELKDKYYLSIIDNHISPENYDAIRTKMKPKIREKFEKYYNYHTGRPTMQVQQNQHLSTQPKLLSANNLHKLNSSNTLKLHTHTSLASEIRKKRESETLKLIERFNKHEGMSLQEWTNIISDKENRYKYFPELWDEHQMQLQDADVLDALSLSSTLTGENEFKMLQNQSQNSIDLTTHNSSTNSRNHSRQSSTNSHNKFHSNKSYNSIKQTNSLSYNSLANNTMSRASIGNAVIKEEENEGEEETHAVQQEDNKAMMLDRNPMEFEDYMFEENQVENYIQHETKKLRSVLSSDRKHRNVQSDYKINKEKPVYSPRKIEINDSKNKSHSYRVTIDRSVSKYGHTSVNDIRVDKIKEGSGVQPNPTRLFAKKVSMSPNAFSSKIQLQKTNSRLSNYSENTYHNPSKNNRLLGNHRLAKNILSNSVISNSRHSKSEMDNYSENSVMIKLHSNVNSNYALSRDSIDNKSVDLLLLKATPKKDSILKHRNRKSILYNIDNHESKHVEHSLIKSNNNASSNKIIFTDKHEKKYQEKLIDMQYINKIKSEDSYLSEDLLKNMSIKPPKGKKEYKGISNKYKVQKLNTTWDNQFEQIFGVTPSQTNMIKNHSIRSYI